MDAVDVEERIRAMLRRGEKDSARALLIAEYDGAVASLCRGMVRDPRLAEDLKQDAFVRALKALDDHRGEGTLRAWLLRIARNGCLDHLRRKRPVAVGVLDPDDAPDLDSAHVPDVIAGLQRAELALAVLEPEDRALVLLHHVQGVEYAELATTFGVSEGALRMRMQRALARMRDELERIERVGERRRRVGLSRFTLWISLTTLLIGGFGIYGYYGVVRPQRESAAALALQIQEMREEAERSRADLEAAQQSGASEEELQRIRDQLAQANANQQAAAQGDTATIRRTVRRSSGSGDVASATMSSAPQRLPDGGVDRERRTSTSSSGGGGGGCTGPLCGLMRSN